MTEQPNRMRSRRSRQMQAEQWKTEEIQEAEYTPVPEQEDLSAYYGRRRDTDDTLAQPAFAPPPKLNQFMPAAAEKEEQVWEPSNVYRPREVTWEEKTLGDIDSDSGYQVQDEQISPPKARKRRHPVRNTLIAAAVVLAAALGLWLAREPLTGLFSGEMQATEQPYVSVVTPEPVKAYDKAPSAEIATAARSAISELSGTVEMETYIVTDSHVVTRNRRGNGSYDFYLFTAREGRLLCYFEGLKPLDMVPLHDGGFYVKQSPYLIAPNGSAMIRTSDVEAQIGQKVTLHPLYRGWAVMEAGDEFNYISRGGQVLSTLWFSRAYPFTGDCTLAYVDTGSTADNRYLLYVIQEDGTMMRWLAADDMADVIVSACGMAYMKNGALYKLPDISSPLLSTPQLDLYLDCDAMVAQDPASGKYGLFVHGEQHYGFVYDSIRPVESDILWKMKNFTGEKTSCTIHAVEGMNYPLPLSHSFVLEKDGQREYVALSTVSSCPVLLDGEF